MEGHARTWFTPKQKVELWERWKSGQCVADIAGPREHSLSAKKRHSNKTRGYAAHPR